MNFNFFNKFVCILLVTGIAGCVVFQEKPLDSTQLDKELQRPTNESLVFNAARLRHPRLNPITLDFSKPLAEDELAVIAVLINPDLIALRTREKVADAQVFAAGLLPDPQISLGVDFPTGGGKEVTAYTLGLNWSIASLFTRPTQKRIAVAQAQQVHYDIAWQEWLISNQARLLSRRINYLQHQNLIAQQAKTTSKRLFDITKENVEAGHAKIDELALRNVAYLDAQDRSLNLSRDLEKALKDLNSTLGLPPDEKLTLAPANFYSDQQNNADSLFTNAKQQRLDLLALQAGYESQDATLYRAILGQYPGFSLGFNTARDTSNVHTQGISIGLDIPIFNGNRGNIEIADATRDQLRQEYIARLQQTRSDIHTLVSDIQRIEQERMPLSQQLPELEREEAVLKNAAESRDVTLNSYETVRATLLDKQLRLFSLEQALAEQQIALQISVGTLLNN